LPRVEIKDPGKVIGTNTVTHIQAGLYYGAVDMVDGMLSRIKAELVGVQHAAPQLGKDVGGAATSQPAPQARKDVAVVATGGQASLVARGSKHIQHTDEFLTLTGLRLIWEKNHPVAQARTVRT